MTPGMILTVAALLVCDVGLQAQTSPEREDRSVLERLERLEKINDLLLKQNQDLKQELDAVKIRAVEAPMVVDTDEVHKLITQHLEKQSAGKAKSESKKESAPVYEGPHYTPIFPHLHRPARNFDLQTLYDSLSQPDDVKKLKKLSIRGYTQIRFARTLGTDEGSAEPNLFGDRSINGNRENFSIRRARIVFSGDVSEHLFVYIQPDFASTPQGSTTSTFFTQLRDLYADVYVDKDKVNRFRVGLSKIPYGWENCQSSQNRIALDRTDAINSAVAPNERDLGVIYYWTPVEKQKLLSTLVNGGLKGSNNFGIFALGVYDGQGGSVPEANLNLHMVSRLTCPIQLANGQVIEGSIQGVRGDYVVSGTPIRPLGQGALITPKGTGGTRGIMEQRVAGSFVVFPQPFGFQAEWQVGEGPGLNDVQTEVVSRSLYGGYLMTMYRHETECNGIFTPYCRYQQYNGGYRNIANAPFGHQRQLDIGVEWQIRKEMELVLEYSIVNVPNFSAATAAGSRSYRDFEGNVLRLQFQVNY